jgi:hypothetical protein
MKPFILEFIEKPVPREVDNSVVEYSEKLNLNVLKGTNSPAINEVYMETETFTRTSEASDTDRDLYKNKITRFLETSTHTFVNNETPDSDRDRANLLGLLDTSTITETRSEMTDTDK